MRKFNRLRRQTRKNLSKVDESEQKAFQRWLDSINQSKRSLQSDLPSSQLPSKMSHLNTDIAQLFAVVDTCSIVNFRAEFMNFVTTLRKNFSFTTCPVKFIVCLPVLEELDKYNRRGTRARQQPAGENNDQNNPILSKQTTRTDATDVENEAKPISRPQVDNLSDICRLSQGQAPFNRSSEPPRSFMRFLEEEMRLGQVILGELDPFKKVQLSAEESAFEIVNTDDRILECCLRSQAFVRSQMHHKETKVILVSEDNIFKSKATTYGIVSYRWTEFANKFKNFGYENYVATPVPLLGPSSCARATYSISSTAIPVHRPITGVFGRLASNSKSHWRTRRLNASLKKAQCGREKEVSQWLRDSNYMGNNAVLSAENAPTAFANSAVLGADMGELTTKSQEEVEIVGELINLN